MAERGFMMAVPSNSMECFGGHAGDGVPETIFLTARVAVMWSPAFLLAFLRMGVSCGTTPPGASQRQAPVPRTSVKVSARQESSAPMPVQERASIARAVVSRAFQAQVHASCARLENTTVVR